MALADLEAFIQQRLQIYDDTIDISSGSPADTEIVQPILQRLGTDPFTVDFVTFAQDRLAQEFPDVATKEGDAITDLLIKTGTVLFDPLIRENTRIANGQSFKDPTILTTDEADALGANLFATRDLGNTALGVGRIYFAQPQSVAISPANFFSSNSGLHFFPSNVQSISAAEMLFNVEGTLYYFDVNLQAEQAGDSYNIDIGQLASIANVTSAVRVTNKNRFRFGTPAETAVDFVGQAEQDLSERSLVTQRGIIVQVTNAFPEVTEVAVVGAGDPNMNRDIVDGGGLGPIVASGFALHPYPDLENMQYTRRVQVDISEIPNFTSAPPGFLSLIGPPGPTTGWVLTIFGGFASVPQIRDIPIKAVIDNQTVDLEDQVLVYDLSASLPWTVRENALTLSDIPGGILFPNNPNGTVTIPNGEIHIGGATDIFIRAIDFDSATLVINDVVDDKPILSGIELSITDAFGDVALNDYRLGTTYALNDATYLAIENAYLQQQTLEILNGPAAGSYRVVGRTQTTGQPASLLLDPTPLNPPGDFLWRLLDTIYIDLIEPKETKISGADLATVQGVSIITTLGGVNFQNYGVGQGDTLRILNGADAGDFTVESVLSPFYTQIQLDRNLTTTNSNLQYYIFRANKAGGLQLPLIRIDTIALLDTSSQPTGSNIPYANPIDGESSSFANVAHGIKEDLTDVQLGIVSPSLLSGANVAGTVLHMVNATAPLSGPVAVPLTGTNPLTAAQIVTQINAYFGAYTAVLLGVDQFGILPLYPGIAVVPQAGDAGDIIWGDLQPRTANDIRSQAILESPGGWNLLTPVIDFDYDVVQILDGNQIGYYDSLVPVNFISGDATTLTTSHQFAPEIGRHIQVGSRSIGTIRLYFLDPTSISFPSTSTFQATLSNGTELTYVPDKSESYQFIPPLPTGTVPSDGVASGSTLTSASTDFFLAGILPGDELQVTYQPFAGSVALTDPVAGLVFQSLVLSISGGPDQPVVFLNDSNAIPSTSVTRAGVVTQINNAAGQTICSLNGSNNLVFEADVSIILRATGTANPTLGFSTVTDTNNSSVDQGSYPISSVSENSVTISTTFAFAASNQHFKVVRLGFQRIVSTQMATQQEVASLYYCDVQLISQGTGDIYNLVNETPMTAAGYVADGYWLGTLNPNLTFSTVEQPVLYISKSILEVGVTDNPANATQISGQNIQINYDRSSLTSNVQNFVSSDEERVVCESSLARHLIPYFVRFDASYVGGEQASDVLSNVESFIEGLDPSEFLNVSDIEQIILNAEASSVQNPISLVAVIHNFDRTISVERSQDKINTGTLAAFVPDIINLTRLLAG